MSETPASRLYHPAVTAALAGTKWETPIEVGLGEGSEFTVLREVSR